MAKIIGLLQNKAGSGKTAIALNLAAELVRQKLHIVLYDVDPEKWALRIARDASFKFPVIEHLLEDVANRAVAEWVKRIRDTAADIIILDVPGAQGAAYGAALAISDILLIPSGAQVSEIEGAADTIKNIKRHHKSTGRDRPRFLIVPNKIDRRTSSGKHAVETLGGLSERLSPVISYRAAVQDSFADGETVSPLSASGVEFEALAKAVLELLKEA